MKLAEALASAEATRYGTKCTVAVLLDELSADDRAALVAALDDPKVTTTQIVGALKSVGHNIGAGTLGRHRRRADGSGCRCPL